MKCVCGFSGKVTTDERKFILKRNTFLKIRAQLQLEYSCYNMFVCSKCGNMKIDLDKEGETK